MGYAGRNSETESSHWGSPLGELLEWTSATVDCYFVLSGWSYLLWCAEFVVRPRAGFRTSPKRVPPVAFWLGWDSTLRLQCVCARMA